MNNNESHTDPVQLRLPFEIDSQSEPVDGFEAETPTPLLTLVIPEVVTLAAEPEVVGYDFRYLGAESAIYDPEYLAYPTTLVAHLRPWLDDVSLAHLVSWANSLATDDKCRLLKRLERGIADEA